MPKFANHYQKIFALLTVSAPCNDAGGGDIDGDAINEICAKVFADVQVIKKNKQN